jgi:hypothetical protein
LQNALALRMQVLHATLACLSAAQEPCHRFVCCLRSERSPRSGSAERAFRDQVRRRRPRFPRAERRQRARRPPSSSFGRDFQSSSKIWMPPSRRAPPQPARNRSCAATPLRLPRGRGG